MWQISYPLVNGASLGSYFLCKKFDSSLKTLSQKTHFTIFEANIVKRRTNTGLANNGGEICEMYEFDTMYWGLQILSYN